MKADQGQSLAQGHTTGWCGRVKMASVSSLASCILWLISSKPHLTLSGDSLPIRHLLSTDWCRFVSWLPQVPVLLVLWAVKNGSRAQPARADSMIWACVFGCCEKPMVTWLLNRLKWKWVLVNTCPRAKSKCACQRYNFYPLKSVALRISAWYMCNYISRTVEGKICKIEVIWNKSPYMAEFY